MLRATLDSELNVLRGRDGSVVSGFTQHGKHFLADEGEDKNLGW